MWVRRLGALLVVAGALFAPALVVVPAAAAAPVSAQTAAVAAPTIGPDCKGDPPLPLSPSGLLSVRPPVTSNGDPFGGSDTSIQSVYGTTFGWWTYDNGCAAGSSILPSLGTNIATLIGFQIPGLAPSWGQALMTAVVNPTWTHQLDSVVSTATHSTTAGVWYPWLTVSLLFVALLSFRHALRGAIPAVVTGVVWSLLVLVVVTWTVNYPQESVDLLDSGIQTAVVSTATGFSGGMDASSTSVADQAVQEMDHEWDLMVRSTLYRSWLQGAFGSPDSATAKTFGPALFTATHFSWSEYDTYQGDPNGKGKTIVDAKATSFRQIADQVQAADPVAYESFTGNNYWDRVGIGFLSLVEMIVVAWFLLVASVIILVAYLLIRLVIPVAPAGGVLFLVEPLRAMALGWLRRIAGLLVMGPLFFLAALIVGRFNSAVMASDLNMLLKVVLVGAVALLAWRLLRPQSMAGRLRIPGLAALGAFVGSKAGWSKGSGGSDDEDKSQTTVGASEASVSSDGPVHAGSSVATRSSPRVFEQTAEEPIVYAATTVHPLYESHGRPGTFAPRSTAVMDRHNGDDEPPEARGVVGAARPVALQSAPSQAQPIALPPGGHSPAAHDQVESVSDSNVTAQRPGSSPDRTSGTSSTGEETGGVSGGGSQIGAQTAFSPGRGSGVGSAAETPPEGVHVANVTYDGTGRPVFQIYQPDREAEQRSGGVIYGA